MSLVGHKRYSATVRKAESATFAIAASKESKRHQRWRKGGKPSAAGPPSAL